MPINKVNLSKLSRCNQYWDEMTPIEGGRLCTDCSRCIVDFRDKTPHEIAVMHAYKQGALCGIYSEEQLNGAKKNIPTSSRFAYAKSLLMGIGVLTSTTNLSAQTKQVKPDIEVVEMEGNLTTKDILKEKTQQGSIEVEVATNPFLVKGKVTDGNTSEALLGVTLWIQGTTVGIATDMMGEFSLDLKGEIPNIEANSEFILVCQYIGFETQEIPLNFGEEAYSNMLIKMEESVEIIEFMVYERRPFHKRVWRTLTFPFRKIGQLFRKKD
ncbi:MAG: carboxypeptidase-like regulatory domain-containing protein [Chitinophagales bacterium]